MTDSIPQSISEHGGKGIAVLRVPSKQTAPQEKAVLLGTSREPASQPKIGPRSRTENLVVLKGNSNTTCMKGGKRRARGAMKRTQCFTLQDHHANLYYKQ